MNTTGDLVDPASTLVIPKQHAQVLRNDEGQEALLVRKNGQEAVIPREAFQEHEGAFYLPTYKDSAAIGCLRGGMRGVGMMAQFGLAEGLAGGAAGIAGGVLGNSLPVDNRGVKIAIGAAAGAATMAGIHAVAGGPTSVPVTLLLGSLSGLTGAVGGSGRAQVRDSMTGGSLTGLAVGLATHNPFLSVTAGAAAALGGQAENKAVRVATSAGVGAALGAVEAVLTHNSIGLSTAITASVAAVGSAVGPVVMQASRNLTKSGSDKVSGALTGWVAKQNDATLIAAGAVPGILSGGLLGSSLGALHPALLAPGIAAGGLVGGALGAHKVDKMLHRKEKS